MKHLLFILISVFVITYEPISVYAAEPETTVSVPEQKYNVQEVINNPDSTEKDYLKAILVCLSDIDLYIQFFVTLVFAIGLVYFVVLKPLRYFLI